MIRLLLFLSIILMVAQATAQPDNGVVKYFKDIRAGEPTDITPVATAKTILQDVLPYYLDTIPTVRLGAYRLTQVLGLRSQESKIRQQAVQYLIKGCADKNPENGSMALTYLKLFSKTDFTVTSKDSIQSFFKKQSLPSVELLKLIGYLEMHQLENDIQPFTQPGSNQRTRWAALLSLSRMGSPSALENMMARVRRIKVGDDLVYDIFPDLISTRQKPAIQYMVDVMKSDSKDCLSADAEREVAIPCGYRIMEQLAPIIQDYPLKLDASGDIKTKNYAEALATVRTWFDKHPEFVVMNNTY